MIRFKKTDDVGYQLYIWEGKGRLSVGLLQNTALKRIFGSKRQEGAGLTELV
jgi:hypothetical protein